MRRLFLDGPLEIVAAVLLVTAGAVAGEVFHREALSVLLAVLLLATCLVYFANAYQDVWVPVRLPRLRRRDRDTPPVADDPVQTAFHCAVCDRGPEADHRECNKRIRAMEQHRETRYDG